MIDQKKWKTLSGCDLGDSHNMNQMREMIYELCTSHIGDLNQIITAPDLKRVFDNTKFLCFGLLCAASQNREKMVKSLLDFATAHRIELPIDEVSAAFNCANEKHYLGIIDLIDHKTQIMSKSLSHTKDRDNNKSSIEIMIPKGIPRSLGFCNFFAGTDFPARLDPTCAQKLLRYYNYDPFRHCCVQDSEQSIYRLLNANAQLDLDILDFNFISSCFYNQMKSVAALIHHPKSRALINTSINIKKYLCLPHHHQSVENDIQNHVLILLENYHLKAQVADLVIHDTDHSAIDMVHKRKNSSKI